MSSSKMPKTSACHLVDCEMPERSIVVFFESYWTVEAECEASQEFQGLSEITAQRVQKSHHS